MFEVGKTYETKNNAQWECIAVTDDYAWLKKGKNDIAYVWTQEGWCVSTNLDEYSIKPKPREFWIYNGMVTDVYHADAIHVREVLE